MEKITVISSTGAAREHGEMSEAGVIYYDNGNISHISAEISSGKRIIKFVEILKIVKEVPEEIPVTLPVRTKAIKKKK